MRIFFNLMSALSESVRSGGKDSKHCRQVLGKFKVRTGVLRWAENHDFATVTLDDPFDEVKTEAGKPVTVGNHKSELISAQRSFQ